MKEIAGFQIGVDIIGQPKYLVIQEDESGKDNGIKIGSYRQRTFTERVREVVHKIIPLFMLFFIVGCTDPEETTEEIIQNNSFVQDRRLDGMWINPSTDDYVQIGIYSVNRYFSSQDALRQYNKNNSVSTWSGQTTTIVSQDTSLGTLELQVVSTETIKVNGVLFFKD